ncbi:hypothetical protein ABT023_06075 [Micromonospora sp. NPDC002296]
MTAGPIVRAAPALHRVTGDHAEALIENATRHTHPPVLGAARPD